MFWFCSFVSSSLTSPCTFNLQQGVAVLSGLSEEDHDVVTASLHQLRSIRLAKEVTDETTHVISSGKRTAKVKQALAVL